MIILKIGDEFPRTCENCPLFVNHMGFRHIAQLAESIRTDEEIEADENGSLNMYYHGYLSKRPQNCPLKEVPEL